MKKILSSLTLLFSLTFSQDAIVVSPSTLDFGNVLMGNTPTQTFTLTCNLDQTITITPNQTILLDPPLQPQILKKENWQNKELQKD